VIRATSHFSFLFNEGIIILSKPTGNSGESGTRFPGKKKI
jgi:hypothetical protein